jgi:hypothetical protein
MMSDLRGIEAAVRCFIACVIVSLTAGVSPAAACPPSVRLDGDRALVAGVSSVLAERGISTIAGACPAVNVTVERRGTAVQVSTTAAEAPSFAREVSDVRTAATVVESLVRTDVEAPLLLHPSMVDRELPDDLITKAPSFPPPRLHVLALADTSVASDRTTWAGFQLRACGKVGRVCLGASGRYGAVAEGPRDWEDLTDRESFDALADADLPMPLGRFTASPGIGLGLGWIHTQEEAAPDARWTTGVLSEARFGLAYPLGSHVGLTSAISVDFRQPLHAIAPMPVPLPSDPRLLLHLGLGLRFDGP